MPNSMEEAGVQAVIRGLGDFKAGAQEMDRAISTASQGMASSLQTVSQKMQEVGASVTDLGKDLSMKLTAPLVALGTLAVKSAMDFGAAMREMGFAIPDVEAFGASIDELNAYCLKLGREGPFAADQVAQAITRLIKAGYDWKQIQEMMPAITDLAIAKDLDLAKSADMVSVALNTFGLNTDQARMVVDSFVQSTNVSLATTDDMAQALTDIGPIAKSLGWEIGDVNTVLALFSSRGLDGSSAVMALRTMMLRVLSPSEDAKQALAALNIQLYDAQGNVKPLPAIFDELSKALGEGATQTVAVGGATKEMTEDYQKAVENIDEVRGKMIGLEAQWGPTGMTYQFLKDMQAQGRLAENLVTGESRAIWDAGQKLEGYEAAIRAYEQAQGTASTATRTLTEAQKIQIAETLFGARGMKALSIIVDEGGAGLEELAARAKDTADAEEEARAKAESFGGQVKQLRASLYSLLVEVGTPILKDFLLPFIHKVVELVQQFQGLDKGTARIIVVIGGLAAAMGPLLIVFGTLISSLGVVMGALGSPLLVPILAIVGAVGLLAAAWAQNWGGIRDNVMEVIAQIGPIIETVVKWFQENIPLALAKLRAKWDEIWPKIKEVVSEVIGGVVETIRNAWTTITTWTDENWPKIQATIATVIDFIRSFADTTLKNVMDIFQTAWATIKEWTEENWPLIQSTIDKVLTFIMDIVGKVLGWITAFWDAHGEQIMSIVQTAWDMIKTAVQGAIEFVLGIIKTIMQLINQDWSGAWETIKETALNLWETIKEIVGLAVDKLREIIENVMAYLQEKWPIWWEAIKVKAAEIWEAIKIKIAEILEAIKVKIGEILEAIKVKWGEIWEAIKVKVGEIAEGIKTKIGEWLGDIKQKIIDAKDDMVDAGKDLMRGVLEGMKEMKDRIIDWIEKLCRGIWKAIKDFFTIGSPSRLMAGLGRDVMGGFLKGLEDMRPALDAQMRMILAPTMQVAAPAMAGGGGGTTIYNYQYQVGPLTANYAQVQSPASILDDLTALQMLAGARG